LCEAELKINGTSPHILGLSWFPLSFYYRIEELFNAPLGGVQNENLIVTAPLQFRLAGVIGEFLSQTIKF